MSTLSKITEAAATIGETIDPYTACLAAYIDNDQRSFERIARANGVEFTAKVIAGAKLLRAMAQIA